MTKISAALLIVLISIVPLWANEILTPSARAKIVQDRITNASFIYGLQPYQWLCFNELVVWCPELGSPIRDEANERKLRFPDENAAEVKRVEKAKADIARHNAIMCRIDVLIECGVDVKKIKALEQYIPADYPLSNGIGYK